MRQFYKTIRLKYFILFAAIVLCADQSVYAQPGQPALVPAPPTITCGGTSIITAVSVGATSYEWFTTLTGGSPFITAGVYITPPLYATTTYYVAACNFLGCSPRNSVTITVNTANALIVPSVLPIASVVCAGSTPTLTASALPLSTYTYRWYDAPVGGTLLFTGNPYTPTAATGLTNYYVEAVDINGCNSAIRAVAAVTGVPNLDVVTVLQSPLIACPGANATLTASSVTGNTIFKWYSSLIGGALLFTGNPFVVPVTTTPTIYYVESVNGDGCASVRIPTLPVVGIPNLDVVTVLQSPLIACPGANASLTASSVAGNTTFKWYSSLIGGDLLFTGNPFVVPVTTTPTIYYVESVNGDGCASVRIPTLPVAGIPNLDVVTVLQSPLIACPGANATLTASSVTGNTIFKWYSSLIGGALLFTGNLFVVPVTTTPTIYYVESVNGDGCASVRIPTQPVAGIPNLDVVTVLQSPLIACPGANASLTASSVAGNTTFKWYSSLIGGTLLFTGNPFVVPVTTTPTIYYVESVNGDGCASVRIPTLPVVGIPNLDVVTVLQSPLIVCPGANATLTASSVTGNTMFKWYSSLIGGALLFTGNPFVVPATTTPTIYYVESVNGDGCASVRIPTLPVAGIPNLDVVTVLQSPLIACPGANATLTASSVTGNTIFKWYSSLIGGDLLFTGNPFVVPVTTTPTIYYVESVNGDGCASVRIPTLPVAGIPNLDVVTVLQSPLIACPGANASLTASSVAGNTTFKWYSSLIGGDLLFTGNPFVVPVTTTPTIYYVESVNGDGCASVRIPTLPVAGIPNLDVVTVLQSPLIACPGANASLTASSVAGNTTFKWYSSLIGGTLLFTGNPFVVPATTTPTIYYVESVNGDGCASVRIPTLPVAGIPNLDVVTVLQSPLIACPGANASLTASSVAGNTTFKWYSSLIGGTLLFTGNPFVVPATTTPTIYYVESVNGDGCASVRIPTLPVVGLSSVIGSISGTTTVPQNPGTSSPIIFIGNGGQFPYTFSYTLDGIAQAPLTTTVGSTITVMHSNANTGTFAYQLTGVTDANGCNGTITPPSSATVTVTAGIVSDLTLSSRALSTGFSVGNLTERTIVLDVSEVIGVTTISTIEPIRVRILKSDNFNYTFDPTQVSANIPGATPVNNPDWNLTTNSSTLMIFTLKPGIEINGGGSTSIAVKLTILTGASKGTSNMNVTIIGGSGNELNVTNNQVVRVLNIF